jgi:site-specific DNA-methyltransferase (adenine-specific)
MNYTPPKQELPPNSSDSDPDKLRDAGFDLVDLASKPDAPASAAAETAATDDPLDISGDEVAEYLDRIFHDHESSSPVDHANGPPVDHGSSSPVDHSVPLPWEIIEGDCLEILETIPTGTARVAFADPPNNLGVDYGVGYNDKLSPVEYLDWCWEWLNAVPRILTDDGSFWVLINSEWADEFGCMLRRTGLHRRAWIVWFESFGVNNSKNFSRSTRHLFYLVKDRKNFVFNREAVTRPSARQTKYNDKRANPTGRLWDDCWGIDPPIPRVCGTFKERLGWAPTQLPIKLLLPIIGCASDPGDLIVDPFSGTATTGVAALQLGRRYLGIERSPEFARLSRERLGTVVLEPEKHYG